MIKDDIEKERIKIIMLKKINSKRSWELTMSIKVFISSWEYILLHKIIQIVYSNNIFRYDILNLILTIRI